MADIKIIRRLALEKGLSINYVCKEDRISNMLLQLSKLLDDNFILKGGTAINRAYLQEKNYNRFSEDIDLDFISSQNLNKKIEKIKGIMGNVTGFDVKSRLMHRTLRFDCFYTNELAHKDKLRTEFYLSHTKLLHTKEINKILLKSNFIETHPCVFNVYSLEDLLARKIVALFRRQEGKDIYDTYYSLDLIHDTNALKRSIQLLLKFYKIRLNLEEFFEELIQKINMYKKNSTEIANSTDHYIPKILRPNWKILINGLITKIGGLG